MELVYFSSRSQNTHRFVNKLLPNLNLVAHRIPIRIQEEIAVKQPFVLFTPTYADGNGNGAIPSQVTQFLKAYHQNLKAVVAGGNINFGKYYAHAGYLLARQYCVPLIHKFELMGTPLDVDIVTSKLQELSCQ